MKTTCGTRPPTKTTKTRIREETLQREEEETSCLRTEGPASRSPIRFLLPAAMLSSFPRVLSFWTFLCSSWGSSQRFKLVSAFISTMFSRRYFILFCCSTFSNHKTESRLILRSLKWKIGCGGFWKVAHFTWISSSTAEPLYDMLQNTEKHVKTAENKTYFFNFLCSSGIQLLYDTV